MTTTEVPFPLQAIVREAIRKAGLTDRRVHEADFWCSVTGPEPTGVVQGWKLHVSATPLSAPLVLHVAAQLLLKNRCEFKFAKDLERVEKLTSIQYDRAQAGKFITAYPDDEEHFHRLADELCDATAGLPGPRILSDRQYRPGSIVQYRFGAFRGVPVLTNDGALEARLRDPAGNLVSDQRKPWFTQPAWVRPLTPQGSTAGSVTVNDAGNAAKPTRPVLDDRFEVLRALRHTARGGVYQAIDSSTGKPVLIKEARAHIGVNRQGRDSRALLAHEARVLAELSPLTPELISLFEQDDHAFLAEQFIEGQSMARYLVSGASGASGASGQDDDVPPPGELALALIRLVEACHRHGWVLRDLSSNNVMITPDGRLVLIDPEFAARPGDIVSRIYTPGFAAPETLDAPPYGPAPDPAADRFAVGAMLIHLVLGQPPFFLTDHGAGHTIAERIRRLLLLLEPQRPLIRQWWPLLTGLCAADPADRWTLPQAADFLQAERGTDVVVTSRMPAELQARSRDEEQHQALADGLDYLLTTMRPDAEWLWAQDAFGATTDPLNVQYGAGGVLPVLARAAGQGYPGTAEALPAVADWLGKRLDRTPRVLPGLYFGRAGTAWALREAADLLGDAELAVRVEQFARQLPLSWPNPDICHGAAGSGLAQLRLWQLSGRAEFLDRARDCADGLVKAACETEDGVFWPVPADFDSALAGAWHFGFAHGVAGVGSFLLAVGQACEDARYLEMANAAGQTLVAAAEIGESGSATWRTDRGSKASSKDMRYHWCSGASGVGSFLLRLATARPGDGRYQELAAAAAQAVHEARWSSGTASCHGLAGNGQFLLDALAAAEQSGSPDAARYRQWAEDIADVLVTRHAVQEGQLLIPDESGVRITAGYGTGLAGVLDFLLRLRHGGPRSWMIEAAG